MPTDPPTYISAYEAWLVAVAEARRCEDAALNAQAAEDAAAEQLRIATVEATCATLRKVKMDTPENQIARINDWLAEHEPDAYHGEGNTAAVVIDLLRRAAHSEDEWHNMMQIARGKLAHGRTVGNDWQKAALDAENFIIEMLE
jgi:hypothetical protein